MLIQDQTDKDVENWDWDDICYTPGLSEQFIDQYCNYLKWNGISIYQKLSEETICKHADKVNWFWVSKHQKLSEGFIEKYSDKVDWFCISTYQKLSRRFIEKHSDKVNWDCISTYQKLSRRFIEVNFDKVSWGHIIKYQKLSSAFIKKYKVIIPESSWMYKDKEWKRKRILATGLYEIIGDKVIAYKTCKKDGYSVYNFQYHYEVGGEYESHADYNEDNQASFGFSAGDKKRALEYCCYGRLFKIEIDLEDIACAVCEGSNIRASKIKILEEVEFEI